MVGSGWQRGWRDEAWQRRGLLGLAVAMALVHVMGVLWTSGPRGSLVQGDARAYFAYLPSLVLDRDLDLRNQFAVLQPEGATVYPFGEGIDRRASNPFPVAPALLWLPGYLVGLGLDTALRAVVQASEPLGYGVGAALGTAAWSILIVGVGAELTRRLIRQSVDGAAFAATIAAWLGTPALYYTVISPLYSHAPGWASAAAMCWLSWRAVEHPGRLRPWIWSGLAAGWVVAVRLQDAPLLVIPGALLTLALGNSSSRRRVCGWSLAWLGAVAAGYLAQGLTSHWLQGEWIPRGGTAPLSSPTLVNLGGILFSLGYRGWISWTPIVLPGLIGLGLLAIRGRERALRWWAWAALAAVAGMVTIDLLHPYGAGASFGGRRYVSATPLVAMGLAALLGSVTSPRARATARIVLPALTAWNLWLLLSYELLIIRHGIYPTLLQTLGYAIGLGVL